MMISIRCSIAFIYVPSIGTVLPNMSADMDKLARTFICDIDKVLSTLGAVLKEYFRSRLIIQLEEVIKVPSASVQVNTRFFKVVIVRLRVRVENSITFCLVTT